MPFSFWQIFCLDVSNNTLRRGCRSKLVLSNLSRVPISSSTTWQYTRGPRSYSDYIRPPGLEPSTFNPSGRLRLVDVMQTNRSQTAESTARKRITSPYRKSYPMVLRAGNQSHIFSLEFATILALQVRRQLQLKISDIVRLNNTIQNQTIHLTLGRLQNEKSVPLKTVLKTINKTLSISYSGLVFSPADIDAWVDCIESRYIQDALHAMHSRPKWPNFLVLYTLRRRISGRRSTLCLFNIIFKPQGNQPCLFDSMDKISQVNTFIRLCRIARLNIPEILGPISRGFVAGMKPSLNHPWVYNSLLASLAVRQPLLPEQYSASLSEAVFVLLSDMKKKGIGLDGKGYLAAAIALMRQDPERALELIQFSRAQGFVFNSKLRLKERILKSVTARCVLLIRGKSSNSSHGCDGAQVESITGLKHRFLPMGKYPSECFSILETNDMMTASHIFDDIRLKGTPDADAWYCILLKALELKSVNPDSMMAAFDQMNEDNIRFTSHIFQLLLFGVCKPSQARKIMNSQQAISTSAINSPKVASAYIQALILGPRSVDKIYEARQAFHYLHTRIHHVHLYNGMMYAEFRSQPSRIWPLYQLMLKNGIEPSIQTLDIMCRAASDSRLKWGNTFAAQEMCRVFDRWVQSSRPILRSARRVINSHGQIFADESETQEENDEGKDDISDSLMRLIPTDRLWQRYIEFLGVCGYQDRLCDVLEWMRRVGFSPSKRTLTALIAFHPSSHELLKVLLSCHRNLSPLSQSHQTSNNSLPVPTTEEIEWYKTEFQQSFDKRRRFLHRIKEHTYDAKRQMQEKNLVRKRLKSFHVEQ